jgi:starch synthase
MGLTPFMMSEVPRYKSLQEVPSVFTIHNAEYQGIQPMRRSRLLPDFPTGKKGLLDWDGYLNALAAGIKSGWQVTTVSETYMQELRQSSNGLELLIDQEWQKCTGIMNGIDTNVWDPATDPMIDYNFSPKNRKRGKRYNKERLVDEFNLEGGRPLISFIGRLVREKGADLLPDMIASLFRRDHAVNFLILGKGDRDLHEKFETLSGRYVGYFDARLEYNEKLAHQIYAGSDFLFMPSRTEPCGLNQMYAMRYGAIPIVRGVGGLEDSVRDLEKTKGFGFKFREFSIEAALHAIDRGLELYEKERKRSRIMGHMMRLDFSWNASAKAYIKLYREIINN